MEQPHDAMLAVLHWLDNVDVLTGSGAGQVCVPGAGTYPMKQLIHNVFSLACVKKAFPRCYCLASMDEKEYNEKLRMSIGS
jgi:hypothetical protein